MANFIGLKEKLKDEQEAYYKWPVKCSFCDNTLSFYQHRKGISTCSQKCNCLRNAKNRKAKVKCPKPTHPTTIL